MGVKIDVKSVIEAEVEYGLLYFMYGGGLNP
jgi:hypothetical protein